MRVGWPQIIFISAALHVAVGLGFLISTLPSENSAAVAPSVPEGAAVTMLLRSEASVGHAPVPVVTHPTQMANTSALPVLSPSTHFAAEPQPQPAALALKDRTKADLRSLSDAVLSPSVSPQVDARNGIVFILDISGSMYERYGNATRLALGRQMLSQRIRDLKDGTPFALVVYAESARRSGPLVPANDATRAAALRFLNQDYDCGGGTDLPLGLALAGELQMGTILLVTDGDLNMTAAELLPKAGRILSQGGRVPALTVVAVGPRPNTDADLLLNELAQQEGGTYQPEQGSNLTASLTR